MTICARAGIVGSRSGPRRGRSPLAQFRQFILFKPNDLHNLNQAPDPRVQMPGVERIEGYRYPAPGSRPAPDIPIRENDDTMYDNKYYDHDLRRNQKAKTEMQLPPRLALEQGMPQVSDGKRPAPPGSEEMTLGSPGNKNPAVLQYDASGLRSAMSATHEEMNKALAAVAPDHLPTYAWEPEIAEMEAYWAANGLPPTPGKPKSWSGLKAARVATW